ncbi:MAG: type II toxin-antitoxin system VapC family toxin [Planctomycetes bacterium]|uniref:type II toxin-antitoxin system VapC family toxin n=1 Tax=Candidatus Wunengus sp. YC65 TaxID=3367701 RepID=UPI001DBBED96|nr:type II toxin-antitoxin system VapC family toxin [Planctomycetota bacterium]MBI5794793.1 type II toxin-antitoxin system VapC family toxin [Planctomycetota bacterium]
MEKDRIYVDTSVFGGVFDDAFEDVSREFFQQIKDNQFSLVTSALVQEEILEAPQKVINFFDSILPFAEIIDITAEALKLRVAYLKADIVTNKYSNDALHVALATVTNCKIIVSWNFKHIVHFKKIPLYNAVNILQGYEQIAIYSPLEVIRYEE